MCVCLFAPFSLSLWCEIHINYAFCFPFFLYHFICFQHFQQILQIDLQFAFFYFNKNKVVLMKKRFKEFTKWITLHMIVVKYDDLFVVFLCFFIFFFYLYYSTIYCTREKKKKCTHFTDKIKWERNLNARMWNALDDQTHVLFEINIMNEWMNEFIFYWISCWLNNYLYWFD